MGKLYTNEEVKLLKELWPRATTKELLDAFPGRTHVALIQKAKSEGLEQTSVRHRKGDMTPLLNDTAEAWYWLGFILADGHINNDGQLVVALSIKDKEHLDKLASFLKTETKIPYPHGKSVRVTTMDKLVSAAIKNKLGLGCKAKTYNPPNISALNLLTENQLEALFLGFFDGDGSIGRTGSQRKDETPNRGTGKIQCHGTWLGVFQFFETKNLTVNSRTDSRGYALTSISVKTLQFLLEKYRDCVPLLQRKWQGHMEMLDGLRPKSL